MLLEIIEGNKVEVRNPDYIDSSTAAKLLRFSRQWISNLMKKYIETQDATQGIECVVIGRHYYTKSSVLKDFYDNRVEKFKQSPSN